VRRTPRNGSGSEIAQAELLQLQKSGQFPDEAVLSTLFFFSLGEKRQEMESPAHVSVEQEDSTGLEKVLLEARYKSGQLNDKKSREGVAVLLSRDGEKL